MSLGMESRALRGRKRERERTELRVRDSLSRRDKGNFGCVMDEQEDGGGHGQFQQATLTLKQQLWIKQSCEI